MELILSLRVNKSPPLFPVLNHRTAVYAVHALIASLLCVSTSLSVPYFMRKCKEAIFC